MQPEHACRSLPVSGPLCVWPKTTHAQTDQPAHRNNRPKTCPLTACGSARSCGDCFTEGGVHILYIHVNRDRGSADGLRSAAIHFRKLIDEKEPRVPDFEFSVHERFAIRPRHTADFFGAKGLFVEFNGLIGALHDQVRGQRVIAIRNRFDPICRFFLSFECCCLRARISVSLWSIIRSTDYSLRSCDERDNCYRTPLA
jgi:hypothetical protein